MSDTNETETPNVPNVNAPGSSVQPQYRPRIPRRPSATRNAHLLFGSVEDLLADLVERSAPDDRVVRIERIVRKKARETRGMATLGIAVTARREDEVLSCWVIVGRLPLDPWGQPTDRTQASALTARHHDAHRIIAALFADAGFDVRLGLYRFPEDCYRFAGTCAALEQPAATQPRTSQPRPDHPDTAEDLASRVDSASEHPAQHGEADDAQ